VVAYSDIQGVLIQLPITLMYAYIKNHIYNLISGNTDKENEELRVVLREIWKRIWTLQFTMR